MNTLKPLAAVLDEPMPISPLTPLCVLTAYFAAQLADGQSPVLQIDGDFGGSPVRFELRITMIPVEVH